MRLPAWEKFGGLKRNYVRIIHPGGKVEDLWMGWLEGAMESSDKPLQIFRSQKQWETFLREQRSIATDWDLRNTLTASDRAFLAALKVSWGPRTMRRARWRASHGHDDDFLYEMGNDLATSFQALSPEQQEAARKKMYEATTGKPYRPK